MKVYSRSQKKLIDVADETMQVQPQSTGMSVDSAIQEPMQNSNQSMQTSTQPKKDGIIKTVAKALVDPAVKYTKMVGGAGYEAIRTPQLNAATEALNKHNQAGMKIMDQLKKETDPVKKQKLIEQSRLHDQQGEPLVARIQELSGNNPLLDQKELETFSDPKKGAIEGAKRTAGMMAYFVPGGKVAEGAGWGAKAAAAGIQGAKVGGLTGFSQSKADDLEGMAVDTATGAIAGAGTGAALSAGGSVLNKMRGAKDAAATAIVNPEVAATPKAMANKDKIIKGLEDMGINKGTAEDRMRAVGKAYDEIQGQVNEIAAKSGATRDVRRLQYNLKTALAENSDHFVPDDSTYTKILDREMALLNKKAVSGRLTTADLVAYKNELAGKLGNAFKKVSGESSSAITPIEGVRLDLWNQMDDLITSIEPGLKELTLKQSLLHQASPGLLKSAEKMSELKPFGVPTGVNLNPAIQSVRDKTGRAVSAIGGVAGVVPDVVSEQIPKAASIITAGGQVQNNGETPPGMDVNSATTNTDSAQPEASQLTVQYQSPDGQWKTMSDGKSYSMDDKYVFDPAANDWVENPNAAGGQDGALKTQLLEEMKNAGSKKEFDLAKAKYDQIVKTEGGGSDKSLTAGQQKELSDIDTSLNIMDSLPTTIKQYEGKMGFVTGNTGQANPYDVDAQTFNATMKSVAQLVGKGMEGGVLRKEDEEKYRKMLPQISDQPQVAYNKIANVIRMLEIQKRTKNSAYGNATADNSYGIDVNYATAE